MRKTQTLRRKKNQTQELMNLMRQENKDLTQMRKKERKKK